MRSLSKTLKHQKGETKILKAGVLREIMSVMIDSARW